MKVIKDRDLALLTGVWGLKNQYYLTLSGLICFDLDHPEIPLLEKEMWALVKKALGKGQVLDAGMPKAQAEVLAYGQCHAPDGKKTGPPRRSRSGSDRLKKSCSSSGTGIGK